MLEDFLHSGTEIAGVQCCETIAVEHFFVSGRNPQVNADGLISWGYVIAVTNKKLCRKYRLLSLTTGLN
jgi:hypothetical protein